MKENKRINGRRLVGAILLTLFAICTLGYAQSLLQGAWIGIVRQFQQFLYFYSAWSIGLAIWYFVTLKKQPNKKAELIVKIIFFVVIALNSIYGLMLDYSDATFLGIMLMIFYAIGCPWGKVGYKNYPYPDVVTVNNKQVAQSTSDALPWYKTWWVWLVIVATIIFISGAFIMMTDGSFRNSSDTTDPFTESHKKNTNTISVDYKKYKIKAVKTYRIGYIDKSWNGGTVKIDKIKIYQTAKPYKFDSANDGKFSVTGFARIYMSVKAKEDINIYPTQGTYSYSNGEQHDVDSMENWDGKINEDITKSGTITVPIKHLKSTSSIKSIRMQFDGSSQDDEDDALDKNFDLTVNLK